MAQQSIFERIIAGQIPAQRVYEDEYCIAIRDIDPQAPVHILIVPKRRIDRLGAAEPEDTALLGHLLITAQSVATQEGLEQGFRVVINNGQDGGETVPHLHVHLLGGRKLAWPPG